MAARVSDRVRLPRRPWERAAAAAIGGAAALGIVAAAAAIAAPSIPGAAPQARLVVVALLAVTGVALVAAGCRFEASAAALWGVASLAAAWLVAVATGSVLGDATPLVAGSLVAVCETAHWAMQLRAGSVDEASVTRGRLSGIVLISAGAAVVAAAPLLAASFPAAGGEDLAGLAIAALVATLALAALLARGSRQAPE